MCNDDGGSFFGRRPCLGAFAGDCDVPRDTLQVEPLTVVQ